MASDKKRSSAAKVAFDSLVEQNSAWQAWIEGAIEFEAVLRNNIPWQQLERGQKEIVSKRMGAVSPDHQLLANSFYVTLVAGFEEYLRAAIREFVVSLNASGKKPADVGSAVLKCHTKEAAGLLRRVDSPPDYMSINFEDLCRSIGSCVPDSSRLHLSVEALAHIESPIKLENFLARMSDLGVVMNWDKLGSCPKVKVALGLQEKVGTRDVANTVQEELLRIARFRNRIAHTGGHAADVSPQIISADAKILSSLCGKVDELINE
ncbi:hypothetical protein EJA70_04170 [Pseudomonas sp. PB103]|uniref:HEPN domain-containing protein n=1 Tax=Pseudomonas sp. PB103 TaxID=2494698 RepID=UPI00131EC521|nr:HEPN domain-containing protein [Pseudomonas sp. PB103]KAE9647883.1 hypothetical protein EJA70_04170 [Pseudomonas sp. PB103]